MYNTSKIDMRLYLYVSLDTYTLAQASYIFIFQIFYITIFFPFDLSIAEVILLKSPFDSG